MQAIIQTWGHAKKGDWRTSNRKCEKPHKRRKKLRCVQVLRSSTFMTHIHASNHTNKKYIIRRIKENQGCFSSFKDSTFEF